MAIALTPFEALCGFRPLEEIAHHLNLYPELAELIGQDITGQFLVTVKSNKSSEQDNKTVLKKVFSAMMHGSQDVITQLLAKLINRLKESNENDTISQLLIRLDHQYPGGDVGVFSCLLLNYVSMEPGQAIFLGANEPHAYLSGGIKKIT
jgi:mannose-6-phosphate isomerase